jgi:hypothetical protein
MDTWCQMGSGIWKCRTAASSGRRLMTPSQPLVGVGVGVGVGEGEGEGLANCQVLITFA